MVSIMLNLKVLPFSGGRYFVSEDCEVYTSNNIKLDMILKDGIKFYFNLEIQVNQQRSFQINIY